MSGGVNESESSKYPTPYVSQPPNKPHPPVAPAPSRGVRRASGKGRGNPCVPKKIPPKNRTERSGSPLLLLGIFFKKNPQKVEGLLGSFWEALGSFWEASGSSGKLPEALASFRKLPRDSRKLLGSFQKLWEASGSSGKLPRPGEASPHFAGSRERRFRLFEQGRQNHQSPNRKSTVQ